MLNMADDHQCIISFWYGTVNAWHTRCVTVRRKQRWIIGLYEPRFATLKATF